MKRMITILSLVLVSSTVFASQSEHTCEAGRPAYEQLNLTKLQLELAILNRDLAASNMMMHKIESEIVTLTDVLNNASDRLLKSLNCAAQAGSIELSDAQYDIISNSETQSLVKMLTDNVATTRTQKMHRDAYLSIGKAAGVLRVLDSAVKNSSSASFDKIGCIPTHYFLSRVLPAKTRAQGPGRFLQNQECLRS